MPNDKPPKQPATDAQLAALARARAVRAANIAAKNAPPPSPPGFELKPASAISDPPVASLTGATDGEPSNVALRRKRDPGTMVQVAQDRLRRHSLTMVRRLEELTELALQDGPKCPTCQRGLPRAEDVRLRAIVAALDRGGLAPQKGQDGLGASSGPVLVFPPGTRIAIDPGASAEPRDMGIARRVDRGITLRRADEETPPGGLGGPEDDDRGA